MQTAYRSILALFAAGAVALGVVACGDERTVSDETTTEEATAPATTEEATPTEAAAPVSSEGAVLPISKDLSKKPSIPKPTGAPPSTLVSKDIVLGSGPAVKAGQTASVQYVGASWSTGKEFDASWDRGQAFPFPIGAGQVIPGWDQGVAGMKVGGRRELVIPPDLGYGEAGSPPVIAPNETLVFVVDLKKIG